MNMISTAFPIETNATSNQDNFVSKLVTAWEKKNSKTARAGGLSLMALSLAACGAEDETAFTQDDIDTAVAAVDITSDNAAAVATAVAAVDITSDNAAAVATAVAAVDITSDNAAAVATAVAAVDITSDNAGAVSLALRNAATEAGAVTFAGQTDAALISAIKTADNAAIAAAVDLTTNDTAATNAAVTALGYNGVTTLAQLNTKYDELLNPTATEMTTGIDTFSATTATTFKADNTGATEVTSSADTLTGSSGVDTLEIFSDGTVGALPKLVSVETLHIFDENTTIDLSAVAQNSVTTANFTRGDGIVTYTLGNQITTVGLNDIVLSGDGGGTADTTIAAGATATSLTVNLSAVSTAAGQTDEDIDVTGAKIATVVINTSGTKSSVDNMDLVQASSITINSAVDLTVGGITTSSTVAGLTITGAGKTSIGALDDGIDTVTGSTATGAITMTAPSNNPDVSITLGSGADVFTTDDDGFSTVAGTDTFAVNAGDGEDTLVIAADVDISTANEAGRYTGFDVLQRAINANYDTQFLNSSIDAASIGDGGLTNMSAAMAGDITITANNAGSTFSLQAATGTADVLTADAKSATAATAVDMTTATITGFETLNFAANSGDANTTTTTDRAAVSFTAAGDLTTITLTGSQSVNVDASANAVKVTSIDASGISGGAIVATGGQTGALTVTGSDVADTVTLAAVGAGGTLTVKGGGGNDTITTTQAIATAATNLDGETGTTNTLNFTDVAASTATLTVNDVTFKNIDNMDTLGFTGAIIGDLTFVLGGYADALATQNGGSLKISAQALISGKAANDNITIDASGLSGTNSINIDIKNTDGDASTAVGVHTLTGSDGADTILHTEVTAASDDTITISSGSGNDTVTVVTSASQDGGVAITDGAGDSTIDISGATSDAASTVNLITAGAGNDTIKLDTEGANTDVTIVAASTAVLNGKDTITNFLQATAEDVFKPDAFLNATALNAVLTANAGTATAVESDVNRLVDIAGGQDITTAAGLNSALSTGEYSNINMAGSGSALFVTATTNAAGEDQHIFFATSDGGGTITAVEVAHFIGGALDIDTWHDDNFFI